MGSSHVERLGALGIGLAMAPEDSWPISTVETGH